MKKVKLEVTPKEYKLLTSALFEYAEICVSESDVSYETDGTKYKQIKTPGLKIAERLDRLQYKLNNQKEKQQ